MMRHTVFATFVAALLCLAATARADMIDPFVGTYVGTAVAEGDDTLSKRDLNFTIAAQEDGGFSVDWTTVIPKDDKSVRKQFKILFLPTRRKGVYSAAMRKNVFGAAVPHDPLKGDPYMWAAIRGKSLFVYGIMVTEEGGYELQIYERTLKPGGMTIRFTRLRDGKHLKDITGEAVKQK